MVKANLKGVSGKMSRYVDEPCEICKKCKHFKDTADGYGHCNLYDVMVHWQDKGCGHFNLKDAKDNLKLQVVRVSNIQDAKELPCGTLVQRGYNAYLVGKNHELVPILTEDDTEEREDKPMTKDFLEEHFVKGAEKCDSPEDILNWYRNLYYKEDEGTERRIVAEAINEFFVYKLPKMLEEVRNEK